MKKWLIIFFILSISPLSAKAFHVLLIGDTKNEDIGTASTKSLRNLEQSFSYISSVSGTPIYIKKLTSTELTFSYRNVERWIREEKIERDDIIVLFYEGHGGRFKSNHTIWPSGYFPDGLSDFSLIIKKLIYKGYV